MNDRSLWFGLAFVFLGAACLGAYNEMFTGEMQGLIMGGLALVGAICFVVGGSRN